MNPPAILHAADFAETGADLVLRAGLAAIERGGRFRLGLAGGRTPRALYETLARDPLALPWENVTLTFGDERTVPPDHPESNWRMVQETLLAPIPIPAANVLRIEGELAPQEAAARYERRLRELAAIADEECYTHDLLLLGLGADGHTASLFPDTDALAECQRWVVAHRVPRLDTWRVTLTLPVINRARSILFLVADPERACVVREVIERDPRHPASLVQPTDGRLAFLLGWQAEPQLGASDT